MTGKIPTTVIGSYPIHPNPLEIITQYFHQQQTPWDGYINQAVTDILTAGIDIITDGQTRDPFIQLFTRKLKGCRIRARTEIIGPITYQDPITIPDQRVIKKMLPAGKQLKGVLTGPFTLANSCVDLYYHDIEKVSFAFAEALRKEAVQLQTIVDYISIDEPFFSNELPDYASDLIHHIIKKVDCPTILHICGDVTGCIPEIFELPVDILSHEFKASPHLLERFKEYNYSQKICLGAVRSDNTTIESVEEITEHINHALDILGEKIVQIAPDCGQRLLPRKCAFQKLENLVKAGRRING
jgi:5-methyltetrahydropteroyltriglutamate--homocysteine methyltransferase